MKLAEVSNVTSEHRGVTHYRFCHVISDITIKSDKFPMNLEQLHFYLTIGAPLPIMSLQACMAVDIKVRSVEA